MNDVQSGFSSLKAQPIPDSVHGLNQRVRWGSARSCRAGWRCDCPRCAVVGNAVYPQTIEEALARNRLARAPAINRSMASSFAVRWSGFFPRQARC